MKPRFVCLILILAGLSSHGCDRFRSRGQRVVDQNAIDAQVFAKRAIIKAMRAGKSAQFGHLTINRTSHVSWQVIGNITTRDAKNASRQQEFQIELYKPSDAQGVNSFLVVYFRLDGEYLFADKGLSRQIHGSSEQEPIEAADEK